MLIIVITLSYSTAAFAAVKAGNEAELLEYVGKIEAQPGLLTAEDGTTTEIAGELVSAHMVGDNRVACTYAYDVTLPKGTGSTTEQDTDQSVSIRAYNTVEWDTTKVNGYTHCLLTRVSGSWVYLDQQVTVTNCAIQYMCWGVGTSGTASQTGSKPSVNNNYSYATGFTKNVQIPSMGLLICQKQTFSLKRGGSTWTFVLDNTPYAA